MPFDILGYYNKFKDYYGDLPLEEVAKDAYKGAFDKDYPDFDSWKKASGIEKAIQEDNDLRNPPSFVEKLRRSTSGVAPVLEEIPRGLRAGVEQVKGMGYGIGLLAGKITDSEDLTQWGAEGLAEVERETPKPKVASFSDIESGSDLAKYLTYGVTSNIPNMALSLASGGVGGFIGKKAVGKVAEEIVQKAITRGAVAGASAASIGMEAGSIAGDQYTETGEVHPLRAMAGAIPAGLLDVVPEWYLAKRIGWIGRGAKEFKGNLAVQSLKTAGQQFVLEAPTEAMQSVLERAAVPGKSITNEEAWNEYIDSFILGGMTGAVVGGGSHAVTGLVKGKEKEKKVENDEYLNKIRLNASLSGMIHTGLQTGEVGGHPFNVNDAIEIIKKGQSEGVYTGEDLDRFKDKYPQLKDGINEIISLKLMGEINDSGVAPMVSTEGDEEPPAPLPVKPVRPLSPEGSGGATIEEQESFPEMDDTVKKIASGKINAEDFALPDNISPADLQNTWNSLYLERQAIEEKNKPQIASLKKELDGLKGKRDADSRLRVKTIKEEIGDLAAEAEIITARSEQAFMSAQEKLANKVMEIAQSQNADVSLDDINEAIAEMSNGRSYDIFVRTDEEKALADEYRKKWQQPLINNILEYLGIERKAESEMGTAPTEEATNETSTKNEAVTAKEPWEMTREEFSKSDTLLSNNEYQKNKDYYDRRPDTLDDAVKIIHQNYIKQALSEGKPVTPEVLKDYPDLQLTSLSETPQGEQSKQRGKVVLPEGWTAEVGKTRTKEGHTAEAEIDWRNKRIVFSGKEHIDNTDMWNHEVAHVVIGEHPDNSKLFDNYASIKSSEWKSKGYDPEWITKNHFHHEEIAMDYGNYLSNPSSVGKELQSLFENIAGSNVAPEDLSVAGTKGARGPKVSNAPTEAPSEELTLVNGSKPNQNGVYPEDNAEHIEYKSNKAHAKIHVAQLSNGKWIASSETMHKQGSVYGHGEPLVANNQYDTKKEAISDNANRIISLQQSNVVDRNDSVTTENQKKEARKIIEWAKKLVENKPTGGSGGGEAANTESGTAEVIPKDGWEKNIIKARDYALRLGIADTIKDWRSLDSIVEAINNKIGAETNKAQSTEEPKQDIMKEISEISDEDLDALLDLPETKTEKGASPPATISDAVAAVKKESSLQSPTKERGAPLPKTAKSLDAILADVAEEGVAGADEALKGLYELFGGKSLKSFPGAFDEDTYAKAKPHFEAALEHFVNVGKGLKEFAATIVQQFGDAIRPYLKRFIKEKRDGVIEETPIEEGTETAEEEVINLDENTGKGERGERKIRRKLTEQEKAEKEAAKKKAAEKKEKKAAMGEFKNVGYVYDPEKLRQKIKDKSPKSAAKIILDEMLPAKLWNVEFPEGTTPGTVRLKDQIQKYFKTFKDFLDSRNKLRYKSGRSIEAKIESWLASDGSIDVLREWANDYGTAMQPYINAFSGQTNITNIVGILQEAHQISQRKPDGTLWNENGTYPENIYELPPDHPARNTEYVSKPHNLYRLLTSDWNRLLDNENDILLSEIDINKRGRNKAIVRVGLPDYRENVELKKTEDFQEPFGFKGVGFGEEGWINQEERNRVIPAAFDAFKDLAATIGAPDNGMSLGGELAVQFANLGHKAKGAAAAYFPGVQTINFTRDNGDGTMSHEWGHAIHHLATSDVKNEINRIIETFYFIYDFDAGERLVDDLLAKDSLFLKRMVSSKKQQRIEVVKNEVRDRYEETVRKETDYYATAKSMDADYTARSQEMWARAFEAYIYDTIEGQNNYLVNDFVSSGRVGGKSSVGHQLVYPSGKEREVFNETVKHFIDGLAWDETGKPHLKEDYVTIEKAHELMLQLRLQHLLDQVEARYAAIWASEPSKDGYFWYRYDETSFGPMMQPDGYVAFDKTFTSEGQNGEGAVAYLTQLHPDVIIDYKLTNIQYEGENPTYISKERGGINGSLSEDGTKPLGEVPSRDDSGAGVEGDVRGGNEAGSPAGVGGTRTPGKQRDATGSSEGDSDEGIHPSPARNYRITDPALNDPKSIGVRYAQNLAAVKTLNLVESENRNPTDEEKDILARYSGWGGMSELFSWSPSEAWEGRAELLKAELSEEDMRAAASSSTSAYYTPVPVGQFMWKLAERLGFTGGVVLDPAVGANGLFLGTMPAYLGHGTALQGIEMDSLSSRIAARLYGLASIENKPFQDVKKPNNRYDLTVTNVPFENITPTDAKHNRGGYSLHNYFINKMLDLTAPGALSMMITTSNTLDTAGPHLTEYAGKAQFVGAIRLPSGIYSATDVATDILVFRKNIEGSKFQGIPSEEWTTTGTDESTDLTVNNYFLNHPEMVAGKLEKITGRYGNENLRVAPEGDLQANLERIASAFPDKIVEREALKEVKSIDDIIPAPGTIKEGGLYINDKNEVCEKIDGEEVKLPVATAGEQKKAGIARGFVHILDQVRAVLRAQKTGLDDTTIKAEQAKLKKFYDYFVKKYGPLNDSKNSAIYNEYTDAAWVLALEEYDPDTGKVTKVADLFTKNIAGVATRPDRAETDHDALAMALDEFGYPNLKYMAKLRNSDIESIMKGVSDKIIENPETGFLETMDEYLSGNVKRKLAIAREMAQSNPEYERNVSLLEAAQPQQIPAHRITARIGASWIDPRHLSDFVGEKINLPGGLTAIFNFNPISNEWSMSFKGQEEWRGRGKGYGENKAQVQRLIARAKSSIEARTVWGTDRLDFFSLMECALQGKRPQVTYVVDKKTYLDEVATQAAEAKLQDIQTEFGLWLFGDAGRADEAVNRFNDLINTSVPMHADGSHLTFPGKSMWMITPKEKEILGVGDAPVFYPHQMNAVWKYVRNGNLYLAHEVGAGKTVTMAMIAMEAKRLRGKRKVLYVTLNDSTMGQAINEIKNLYPLANIMPVRVSTNEQRQQRTLQKMAMNDFDIAIMRQQDIDRIALSPESERVFIEEEMQELREVLEEVKASGVLILEQDIQRQIHALEEKLRAPGTYAEAKGKNLFFDDLGIDLMIVDEAHSYKNVPYATRLTRITGLNPAGSPTARAFFRKTQYLNALFPKHDAVVLASGTALSNSIAELYNIQRMLQPQEVKRQGNWSFDRWIANYGDMGSQMEWDGARGQYKVITTNRKIVNAGRLLATAFQNIDSIRADDTPIKRPAIRGGEPQRVVVSPNQYVEHYKQIILDRCRELESDPRHAEFEGVPDNMLRIISNMSKVAIDQRLDHHYTNTEMQQDSKIAKASETIYRRWKEEEKHKGVQLVFADMGIPKKYEKGKFKYKTDEEIAKLSEEEQAIYNEEKFEYENAAEEFNVYEGLKNELIKLGIPANQIAFIHDADDVNKDKKAAKLRGLFKKVNAGVIRVLIGSTSKAGTGVNIQQRVSDIHHLDVWWNFSAWEQRNGRGIRAGNIYADKDMPGTYIWNYVTETTVDATRWDKIFAKGKVLNAVLDGDINLDVIEDISDETMSAKMMAAEASGDPLMATHATLLHRVQELRFEQAAHLDVVRNSRMELAAIPGKIEASEKKIVDAQRSRNIMDKVTAVRFAGDNRTLVLAKHGKEIAEALEKAVAADTGAWSENKKAPLLVFGSHTETETIEKTKDKDGEETEKKVKKYDIVPLLVKAEIMGQMQDPFGRRLLISGNVIGSERALAEITIDKAKKATVEIKANISRTVTEYLTALNNQESRAKDTIEELKANEPKLKKVIAAPWAKAEEYAGKDKELRDIETQMSARGVSAGNPETGIPIEQYKGMVPMLEDVADTSKWHTFNGIVFPMGQDSLAISKPVNLSNFTRKGKVKINLASRYSAPENLEVLEGGKPSSPEVKPIAYTTIDNVTRFWVPNEASFVTIDPAEWNLLQRIIGNKGSWHYVDLGIGDKYLIHIDNDGGRDAYIRAQIPSKIPSGIRDIYNQSQGAVQYSRGTPLSLRGLTTDRVQTAVGKVASLLKNPPKINIVQHVSEVPAAVLEDMEENGILDENMDSDVQGFTWEGEIWLVGDNVHSAREAVYVLTHELVHEGLGRFLNSQQQNNAIRSIRSEYDALMNAIYKAHYREIREIARTTHTHLDLSSVAGCRAAAEEWLCNQAYEAQPKWYDRLVAIFHDLLRAMGFDVKLSDEEVRTVLQDAFSQFKEEGLIYQRGTASKYAIGQRLRESSFPRDDVEPSVMSTTGSVREIVLRASQEFKTWPDTLDAADGKTILLKNPEQGSLGMRVKHLIWDNSKDIIHFDKARWLPNVPDTLRNAAKRIYDPKYRNNIYAREYNNGVKHMVVVNPKGIVVDQDSFSGRLETHFPYLGGARQDNMRITWEREGEGASQGSPNPSRPVSTHPDTRQAGPGINNKILSESDLVKGKADEVKYSISQEKKLNAVLDKDPFDEKAERMIFSGNTISTFLGRFTDNKGIFRPNEFFRDTGIHLNISDSKDLNPWVRRVQIMQDLAKNYPAMRQLLDAQIEGEGKASQLSIADRGLMKPYFTLPEKSVSKVNMVLFEGDQNHRIYSNEELRSKGLAAEEIKGYWAARSGLDEKMEKVILPSIVEDGLSMEASQNIDIAEIIKAIQKRNNAMSSRTADKEKIEARFLETINAIQFEIEAGEGEKRTGQLSPQEVEIIQHVAKWAFNMRAYVPHEWEGAWRVKVSVDKPGKQQAIESARREATLSSPSESAVMDAVEKAAKEYTDEYMLEVPTIRGNIGLTREMRQRAAERAAIQVVREKFRWSDKQIQIMAKEGRVLLVKSTETPVELFSGAKEGTMKAIVNAASDKVMADFEKKMEPSQRELMGKMRESVQGTIEEFYLAKGWGRHLIHRKGTLGYREDLRKTLAKYFSGVNAYVAKREKAIRFGKIMADVNPIRTPELWRAGSEYASDMLGPAHGEARVFKNVVGLFYMAGDLSNAALNMTQNFTHAVALLRAIEPKTDRITADREIARAMKDIAAEYISAKREGRDLYGKATKHITSEEAQALRDAYEKGWLDPAMFGETTGFHKNKIYLDYISELHRKLYFAFTGTEGWNRMSTFLAAYRRAQRAETENPALEARRITEAAHFVYGRGNRPEIVRKMGALGNILYTFMTYPIGNITFLKHRLETLKDAQTPSERRIALKVIGSNLAYIFAFGGINALPFSWLAKLILKIFDDPEDDWEKRIYEKTPVPIARTITRGIPAVFGNDMSWKVEGTDIFMGAPAGFQVGRSIYRRIWERGVKPLSEGDYWHVIFMAMPDMIMNPYRAFFKEGGTGRAGAPVIEYTEEEKTVAAFGFTPTRESETRKAQELSFEKLKEHQEKIRKWADRVIVARRDNNREGLKEVWKDIKQFNEEQREEGGARITWGEVLAASKRREKAKTKKYGERLPKYMRPFQRESGKSFGLNEYGA